MDNKNIFKVECPTCGSHNVDVKAGYYELEFLCKDCGLLSHIHDDKYNEVTCRKLMINLEGENDE